MQNSLFFVIPYINIALGLDENVSLEEEKISEIYKFLKILESSKNLILPILRMAESDVYQKLILN